MTLATDISAVETNRLAAVVTPATAVDAAAVSIAQTNALITCFVGSTFSYLIVAQLISSVFVLKTKLTITADLAALHAKPGSLFFLAIMSQLAHALEQLVIFRTPGVVVQRISRKYGIHAGSRFNVRVIRIIRFYWHYFKTIQFPFCHPGAKHFVF